MNVIFFKLKTSENMNSIFIPIEKKKKNQKTWIQFFEIYKKLKIYGFSFLFFFKLIKLEKKRKLIFGKLSKNLNLDLFYFSLKTPCQMSPYVS